MSSSFSLRFLGVLSVFAFNPKLSGDSEFGRVEISQAGAFGGFFQLGDDEMLVIGDRLFADSQPLGGLLVRPAEHEQQLQTHQPFQFAVSFPVVNQILQAVGDDCVLD